MPPDGLAQELVVEAQEVVESLGRALVSAEASVRQNQSELPHVNAMFRAAHTLKGLGNLMGLPRVSRLAHAMEDGLEAWRMGRRVADGPLFAAFYGGVELCEALVAQADDRSELAHDDGFADAAIARFAASLAGGGSSAKHSALSSAQTVIPKVDAAVKGPTPPPTLLGIDSAELRLLSEYELHRLRETLLEGRQVVLARASFEMATCTADMVAFELAVASLCEVIARVPRVDSGGADVLALDFLLGTAHELAVLKEAADLPFIVWQVAAEASAPLRLKGTATAEVLGVPSDSTEAVLPKQIFHTSSTIDAATEPELVQPPRVDDNVSTRLPNTGAAPTHLPAATHVPPQGASTAEGLVGRAHVTAMQTVRVDVQRLDHLMHLAGELTRTKDALHGCSHALSRGESPRSLAVELRHQSRLLERRVAELRAGILATRMVPIGQLFERLVRAGRKVAQELGLEVDIVVSGEGTEIDKLVVEELAEPLLHLVRNAVDHGIEPPVQRQALGKAALGYVHLQAEAKGSHVCVRISDDGRGIDAHLVAARAKECGFLPQQDQAPLVERDLLRLLWLPGFSTRETVSEYSGRGVGLDVVRTRLEALGGHVEVDTVVGQGTTFTLMAPITRATLPALVVGAVAPRWALPIAHVVETVHVRAKDIATVQGRPQLELRGELMPFIALDRLVERGGVHSALAHQPGDDEVPAGRFAIVVGQADRRLAVSVERIFGRQDLLTKGLGPRLGHLRGLSGAAELNDQQVILVLDMLTLLDPLVGKVVTNQRAERPVMQLTGSI